MFADAVLCDCCRGIDIEYLMRRPINDTHDLNFLLSIDTAAFLDRSAIHKHPHHKSFNDLNKCAESRSCAICQVICYRFYHTLAQNNASITDIPTIGASNTEILFALRQGSRSTAIRPNRSFKGPGEDELGKDEANHDGSDEQIYWTGIVVLIRNLDVGPGQELSLLSELRVYSDVSCGIHTSQSPKPSAVLERTQAKHFGRSTIQAVLDCHQGGQYSTTRIQLPWFLS